MDRNKEVKKILDSRDVYKIVLNKVARELDLQSLAEVVRIWNEDGTSGIATGANEPKPPKILGKEETIKIIEEAEQELFGIEPKPNKDRLLTEEELAQMNWEIALADYKDNNKKLEQSLENLATQIDEIKGKVNELRERYTTEIRHI